MKRIWAAWVAMILVGIVIVASRTPTGSQRFISDCSSRLDSWNSGSLTVPLALALAGGASLGGPSPQLAMTVLVTFDGADDDWYYRYVVTCQDNTVKVVDR